MGRKSEPIKIGKQLKYVDERAAPYAIIVGSEEMKSGRLALKHMRSGEQEALDIGFGFVQGLGTLPLECLS